MVSGFSAAAFGQVCGQETPPGAAAALGSCMDRLTSSKLFPAHCGGMHGCCSGLQKKCHFLKMRKGNVDSAICLAKKNAQDFDNTVVVKASRMCQLQSLKHKHPILHAQYKQVAKACSGADDWFGSWKNITFMLSDEMLKTSKLTSGITALIAGEESRDAQEAFLITQHGAEHSLSLPTNPGR